MTKRILLLILFTASIVVAQPSKQKIVVIIRPFKVLRMFAFPTLFIDGKRMEKIWFKGFKVYKTDKNTVNIGRTYRGGDLIRHVVTKSFNLEDSITYIRFYYKGSNTIWLPDPIPVLDKVNGDELMKLKKSRYVRKKIKQFQLE